MNKPSSGWRALIAIALLLAGCSQSQDASTVDQARITAADSEPQNWLSYGRTYSEQRFSPLNSISTETVGRLGLVWSYEARTPRGAESTPIVIDGVIYFTSAWSIVYAVDAHTGKELWVYDPLVDRSRGALACCDAVNRGVAAWKGRIYVGTLDGRLVAIDAKTGKKAWETQTFDKAEPYSITGAPRIAKGLVFIGNGGAEYGVRGYVSAYDADSGALKWRFYTVPGDPAKGPDGAASDPQMRQAAATWKGEFWKVKGGGTVWDAIVYDPELDQLYIGVGNGSPWNHKVRSPGGGDNLFLSSIVALKPDTGRYLWHYQTTPGESWDFTATQPIMLADLSIAGKSRKVLMQAPKNGFFYVIDRHDGKLISAKNFVPMAKDSGDSSKPLSWAYGVDLKSGRPLENPRARYSAGTTLVTPTAIGAHNWQPMSYNPGTGLAYFPVNVLAQPYGDEVGFRYRPGFRNMAVDFAPVLDKAFGAKPPPSAAKRPQPRGTTGYLIAWDPVRQKEVWRVPHDGPFNGGTLSTAGNLVFEASGNGIFAAYNARTGRRLWQFDLQAAGLAGAVTYSVKGRQYVAIMSGYGGTPFLGGGFLQSRSAAPLKARLNIFALDGKATLPDLRAALPKKPLFVPPASTASAAEIKRGATLYANDCASCHGPGAWGGGVLPDLRRSPVIADVTTFQATLAGGRIDGGMPDFTNALTPDERLAIRAYLIDRAQLLYVSERPGRQ